MWRPSLALSCRVPLARPHYRVGREIAPRKDFLSPAGWLEGGSHGPTDQPIQCRANENTYGGRQERLACLRQGREHPVWHGLEDRQASNRDYTERPHPWLTSSSSFNSFIPAGSMNRRVAHPLRRSAKRGSFLLSNP